MNVLVIFNIKFKQELEKIKKILLDYRFKEINQNTFIGDISVDYIPVLKGRIGEVAKNHDSITIIPLCKGCSKKMETIGKKINFSDERYVIL